MSSERWAQVKALFEGASERPPEERTSWLSQACGGDEALRTDVASLLAAYEQVDDFLETPAGAAAHDALIDEVETSPHPDRIGPYRILREIGRGGMGTVYLAERDDEAYHKRVAIKLVRVGPHSPFILRRFRYERQILANLDHPNIARLLDGGTTDEGRPYLIMEYVEGTPIDAYCDRAGLAVAARLELFRQVCAAVEYAHQNLVVHRDLKPGNVLVTGEGTPKLLDFGIAKLLDAKGAATPGAGATATGIRMLTPEYASPEQVRGEPVTTGADVYALGVLLYRLLTGRSPYRLHTDLPHELAAAICEQEPALPSVMAVHARRRLAGDLDTIVLKALQKDPARRYASVAQFSEDIRRHLGGLPVIARKDTLAYRARKFVSRHTVGVAAAAAILLTLVGGVGATVWQARRAEAQRALAERRFADARRLANAFIVDVDAGIEKLSGSVSARQLVVRKALEYLDGLAREAAGDPTLQRELAAAYEKMGDLQGRPRQANLGDSAGALESYRKALVIREALAAAAPGNREAQLDLWSSYSSVGLVLGQTGETRGALEAQRKAHTIVQAASGAAPADVQALRALRRTHVYLCDIHTQAGELDEGLASARRALAIAERLAAGDVSDPRFRSDVAMDHGRVGLARLKLGDREGALRHFREKLVIADQLRTIDPANPLVRRCLSSAHAYLGQALAQAGSMADALRHQLQAVALREDLATADPANRQAQLDVAFVEQQLGDTLAAHGELRAAAERYRNVLATAESLVAADRANVFYQMMAAATLGKLAAVLARVGEPAEGLVLARRALALIEPAAAADAADARLRSELALAHARLGEVQVALAGDRQRSGARREQWSDARASYRRSLDVWREMRDRGVLAGGTLDGREAQKIAEIERAIARCDRAIGTAERASSGG